MDGNCILYTTMYVFHVSDEYTCVCLIQVYACYYMCFYEGAPGHNVIHGCVIYTQLNRILRTMPKTLAAINNSSHAYNLEKRKISIHMFK